MPTLSSIQEQDQECRELYRNSPQIVTVWRFTKHKDTFISLNVKNNPRNRGLIPDKNRNLPLLCSAHPGSVVRPFSSSLHTGGCFLSEERPLLRRETDHLPPSTVKVRMCAVTIPLLHIPLWCVHRKLFLPLPYFRTNTNLYAFK